MLGLGVDRNIENLRCVINFNDYHILMYCIKDFHTGFFFFSVFTVDNWMSFPSFCKNACRILLLPSSLPATAVYFSVWSTQNSASCHEQVVNLRSREAISVISYSLHSASWNPNSFPNKCSRKTVQREATRYLWELLYILYVWIWILNTCNNYKWQKQNRTTKSDIP